MEKHYRGIITIELDTWADDEYKAAARFEEVAEDVIFMEPYDSLFHVAVEEVNDDENCAC